MLKKLVGFTLALVLLVSIIPASGFAVTINEDVTVSTPIFEDMESTGPLDGISAQLTSPGKSVDLSTDASEGTFSWRVTTTTETPNPYAQYTLVSSSQFNIAEYSSITIWVKPARGASWISFYTNNALITCDKDKDGQFEVGADLTSGKWTQLTLDLLMTDAVVAVGDDLVIRSNDNSVWGFDEVKARGTKSTSIDLSTMVNSSTTMNNGKLQFKKTGDGATYIATPTTLISNRDTGLEKVFNKQTDFAGGAFVNCTGQTDGSIVIKQPTLSGTAISSGDNPGYTVSKAFDGDTSTNWVSSVYANNGNNAVYIGFDFGTAVSLNGLSICTPASAAAITGAHIQYYDNSAGQWITIATMPIQSTSNIQYYWFTSSITTSKMRLLQASYKYDLLYSYWQVYELKFISNSFAPWSYTSPVIDISTPKVINQGSLSCTYTGSSFQIETTLSQDDGVTWQSWSLLNEDGTINGITKNYELQSAKIRYRLSGVVNADAGIPVISSVGLSLQGAETNSNSLAGTLSGVKIDSIQVDILGNNTESYNNARVSWLQGYIVHAISGDGKTAFVTYNGNLYSVNIDTGESKTIPTSMSPYTLQSIIGVKANYDGTVIAMCGTYNSNTDYHLYKYDSKASSSLTRLCQSSSIINYDIGDNGGIIYSYRDDSNYLTRYCNPLNVTTQFNTWSSAASVSIADNSMNYCIYIGSVLYFYNNTSSIGYYVNSTISDIYLNSSGDTAYFNQGGYISSYNVTTKTFRQYTNGLLSKVLDSDKLLVLTNNKYSIYDPSTNSSIDITPVDLAATAITLYIDSVGQTFIYQATDGNRIKYNNSIDKVTKYLLSFDSKNTWYSYNGGTWQRVYSGKTPDTETLTKYGMTADQINALTVKEFAPLYSDGNEIYSVDFAVYFNSVSPNYSPSISSIKIITDANNYGDAGGMTANPLYAVKKEDFAGSTWRKVNKIYPVEICNKASDYAYFIYVDHQYVYYNGSAWVNGDSATIAAMIPNVNANWAKIVYYGMTAEEVRAIPQSTLTSELAHKDFSVVYFMRVPDKSTVGYYSIINVDYTQNLYESNTLTLIITYFDGRTQQIAGITSEQIEDFMDWLLNRTKKSPTYFTVKVGSLNYYINYNTISDVSVTES